MEISGWGRYPKADCNVKYPRSDNDVCGLLAGGGSVIARGNGRAYGDSALNAETTIDMTRMNRMIDFDPATGILSVEAGVMLGDIIKAFLPRGWFPPVTPGTKFVSVGGMIAADVHGKNHHKHGTFGKFVEWIDLVGANGNIARCSRHENADLFYFTIGGMGLTGIILRAAFRLTPVETGWIRQKLVAASCLSDAMETFESSDDWTYSVAWIDCLASGPQFGRSLITLGEHARKAELDPERLANSYPVSRAQKIKIPIDFPGFALNGYSVRAFNTLYYRKGLRSAGESLADWDSFFYPLDGILDWNKIYGRNGFAQFQCVIPLESSKQGMTSLLSAISRAGEGSFLAVLKRMGIQDSKYSFPMEGYTLALDFPISTSSLALMDRLDAITLDHDGRFYLAKDSRMRPATLEKADDRTHAFRKMREATCAVERFASLQSRRLLI